MNSTASISKRRKNIDIPLEVFDNLSIKAAFNGISLKVYIEQLLTREANNVNDNELYQHLVSTQPDGNMILDKNEKQKFEDWLGI